MKLFILLILPFLLHASKILSYNIYDRSDRVDVMITFDIPFEGSIKQSSSDNAITIKLEGASIESSKVKQLNSKFIKSITITPMQDYTQIVANVPSSIKLQASKTADAYGLRLRFVEVAQAAPFAEPQENKAQGLSDENQSFGLPTKQGDEFKDSYYVVIGVLIIGIILLLIVKRKFATSTSTINHPSSWLFQDSSESIKPGNIEPIKQNPLIHGGNGEVTIRFQKVIDSQNSVVMLDFMEQSYLVLMGKDNILLDKFTDNKPSTQSEFETILQNRHKQLDDFLNSDDSKEALRAYKERAASISYEV